MINITKLIRNKSFYILLLSSIIICLFRLHTLHEPFERDIGTYAVYGHELLLGKNLYVDLFDHKPPLIYYTYAIFESIFGYGDRTIWIMNVTFSISTLISIYFIGKKYNIIAGFLSAIIWAILSGNIPLQANQPNTEVFLNTFLIAGFFLFIINKKNSFKINIFIGFLMGLSSLYKHISFIPIALFALTQFSIDKNNSLSKRVLNTSPVIFGPIILWLITILYFFIKGYLDQFIFAVFQFNIGYSGQIGNTGERTSALFNIILGLNPTILFTKRFYSMLPFIIFFLIGLVTGIINKKIIWLKLAVYTISVIIMISIPGKWYPHYYQLWLPIFTIGGAWMLSDVIKNNFTNRIITYLIIALMFISGCIQLRFIIWTPDQISYIKYGRTFIEAKQTAEYINRILPVTETFYQFGSDPVLYYYTKRRLPSGITFITFLDYNNQSVRTTKMLLDDLTHNKPELIVLGIPTLSRMSISEIKSKNIYHQSVIDWINNNYIEPSALDKGYLINKQGLLRQIYK